MIGFEGGREGLVIGVYARGGKLVRCYKPASRAELCAVHDEDFAGWWLVERGLSVVGFSRWVVVVVVEVVLSVIRIL